MTGVRVALAIAVLLAAAEPAQRGRRAEPPKPCEAGVACCPFNLIGFGRAGPPPVLVRRVAPDWKTVRRPHPEGLAILEVGINDKGRVVSACVLRGVRSDFDEAAQSAALKWVWKPKILNGKPVSVVMTVTFTTPARE